MKLSNFCCSRCQRWTCRSRDSKRLEAARTIIRLISPLILPAIVRRLCSLPESLNRLRFHPCRALPGNRRLPGQRPTTATPVCLRITAGLYWFSLSFLSPFRPLLKSTFCLFKGFLISCPRFAASGSTPNVQQHHSLPQTCKQTRQRQQRYRNMTLGSDYSRIQARIPELKQLFQSRHYIQCATLCERYLTQFHEVRFQRVLP